MKKAEELKLYAPEPKRPELDAALCMSVAEGQGVGRYIKGKVLTVAVWDKKEKPLVVWRFFGGYWTGELRGNKNPKKNELSPRQIEVKPCQCLTWRTEVPATKGESELLQNYFDDRRPGYLIGIVEDALSAHAKKKREERNARQAAETQKLFENLPEPPEDFSKQVLKVCSDAGFLWVTNDRQGAIEPGGVEKKILIQRARCDSCGGEYTLSELLKHKSTAVCECCGEKMQVRNAEARTSYTNRVASRGTGTVASIVSLLYSDVEGVTFAAGYENYNDTTDAEGRPPHSIEIVVQGGTDEDVANIIWKNKAGGIRAYGKHYAYATDVNGNRQYLEFTRVNDVYLLLSITVTSSGGLDDDYVARIKSLLMEENLSAGATIRLQKFIRPIMENVSGVDYIEIRGLLSEKPEIETVADSSMLTGIVPVQINQQPIISMSGIRVVKA